MKIASLEGNLLEDALSRALDEKRGLVAYHLNALEERGLLN